MLVGVQIAATSCAVSSGLLHWMMGLWTKANAPLGPYCAWMALREYMVSL